VTGLSPEEPPRPAANRATPRATTKRAEAIMDRA
jgi:hypothetical protein